MLRYWTWFSIQSIITGEGHWEFPQRKRKKKKILPSPPTYCFINNTESWGKYFTNCNKTVFFLFMNFKMLYFKTIKWFFYYNSKLKIPTRSFLKPTFNTDGIFVICRCMIASRNPLVFSWTCQVGTWVLVAMNDLSTGLTWLTRNGCLLWLVDCVVEHSSDFPTLGRTCVYIQRVSTGLGRTASDAAVSQKAHLFWQEA